MRRNTLSRFRPRAAVLLLISTAIAISSGDAPSVAAVSSSVAPAVPVQYGTYDWPVYGPVIRGFEAPSSPYTAGHRGIDIATAFGTPVVASSPGVVAFAGKVAGSLFISIDHRDGVRTTYSWLSSIAVKKGQQLKRGDVIGLSGFGHPGASELHLHFGAKLNGDYIDPLELLRPIDVSQFIRLAAL